MSAKMYSPMTKAVGQRDRGKKAHASQGEGHAKMSLGKASCLADRKGRFSGTGYDLRDHAGGRTRFTSRLSKADQAGGQKGAGHTSQPKGHRSMVKGMKG